MDDHVAGKLQGDGAAASNRRRPAQQRSRERVEKILTAARDSIAAGGSDQMKMSEVAARSAMSIGALYQYFPDKAAIIRQLAERYNVENRRCIADALGHVKSRDELEAAFAGLMDDYLALMRAEPAMRDIWSGMQSDKSLIGLQATESRACAALLAGAMHRVRPGAAVGTFDVPALLVWDLGEAAVRLAMAMQPGDGDAAVAIYKRMAIAELLARLDESEPNSSKDDVTSVSGPADSE